MSRLAFRLKLPARVRLRRVCAALALTCAACYPFPEGGANCRPSDLSCSGAAYLSFLRIESRGKFVYVANFATDSISGYALDFRTGALAPLSGFPKAAGDGPAALVTSNDGRRLYVANGNALTISAYDIDPTSGALTEISGSPFGLPATSVLTLAIDPRDRYLYLSRMTAVQGLAGFQINSQTGALTSIPGAPFLGGSDMRGVAVSRDGQYVFHSDNGNGDVQVGAISDASGAPVFVTGIAPTFNPEALTASRSGDYLFIHQSGGQLDVVRTSAPSFPIVASFGLAAAHTSDQPFAVHPLLRFVYLPLNTAGIDGLRFDATSGVLSRLPGAPFSIGNIRTVAYDPSGRYLYALANTANELHVYETDSTSGALTVAPGSPYALPGDPREVAIVGETLRFPF